MSIFRDTFTPEISASLAVRQNAMVNRTPQNIQYLNARSAWIRMTSAVNVYNPNTQIIDDALAKQYVLLGGTLLNNDKLRAGVGDRTKAYSQYTPSNIPNRLGIRPMAGITSLDIKSKSAYGSLREVTVNFQCWDIRQLEDLELLYMRPGYTVLVEWGWLPYLKNDGTIEKSVPQFYDILDKKETNRSEIFLELFNKSKASGGNYDAMYGYIKNYQWSAREDGGYDCQVTVISTGEIIESLKVNYVRADLADYGFYTAGSIGKGYLNELFDNQGVVSSYLMGQYYEKNTLVGVWAELWWKLSDSSHTLSKLGLEYLENKHIAVSFPALVENGENTLVYKNFQWYITLEAAFDIMNKYIIAKSDSKDQEPLIVLSTKTSTYAQPKESEPLNLLGVAHPLQISVDPSICLIKNNVWIEEVLPVINESTTQENKTALSEKVNSINRELRAASSGDTDENRFLKAIKSINNALTYAAINNLFQPGVSKPNGPWEDGYNGIDGLIKYEFTTSGGNTFYIKSIDGSQTNEQTSDQLGNLYYVQQIQRYLRDILHLSVDVTVKDNINNTNISLDKIKGMTDFPIGGKFFDFARLIDPVNLGAYLVDVGENGIIYSFPKPNPLSTQYEFTDIKITPPPGAQDAAVLTQKTSDAIASLDFLKNLPKNYFYNDDYDTELGVIGNIYVNLNFLYKKALDLGTESQDTKEKSEINLYNYVKSIISAIQPAIGNVNSFEIHVDPIDNIARVIDINFTAPTTENLFELQVHNTKSVVRKYSLQSQIFPNQGAMIAIGSQAKGGQLGMQNNTMIDFNRNLIDRITPEKSAPVNNDIISNNTSTPKVAGSLAGIVRLFSALNIDKPKDSSSSTSNIGELTSRAKNCLRDLIVYFQQLYTSPGANRNIIPIKFSFEMDGIGGLVIGHLFKVNQDILPKGYKGPNLAQTVTGIGHTISSNDWITKVDALNIILDRALKGAFGENLPKIKSLIEEAINLINKLETETPVASFLKPENPKISISSASAIDDEIYKAILTGIGASVTAENFKFLYAWRQAEGGTAAWNPFNTTWNQEYTTTPYNCNDGNPVKNYASKQDGIDATVKTLKQEYYTKIRTGLINNIGAYTLSTYLDEFNSWGTRSGVNTVLAGSILNPPPISQKTTKTVTC